MTERESASAQERENGLSRRTALKVFAAAPIVLELVWSEPEVMEAWRRTEAARAVDGAYEPKFFTPAEWKTVRVLSDLIIPADARSGSATDVGVPEFMDFMMIDAPSNQPRIRNGLVWLDAEMQKRRGRVFTECDTAEQAALLDVISWPKKALPEMKDGATFFVSFRNLVLTGFWTSKVGIKDLQYMGNTFVRQWHGCPPEALAKLGVSYNE